MTAPSTISATGYFLATRAGMPVGEATLAMRTALKGRLTLGTQQWNLVGDAAIKKFHGTARGSAVDLKIVNRNLLKGTVDGDPLLLARAVLRPIPAAEMAQSDAGPTGAMKTPLDATPDYEAEMGDSAPTAPSTPSDSPSC